MGQTELESKREKLAVEHDKIVALARQFMIFIDEPESTGVISIEMLRYDISKMKLLSIELQKDIKDKKTIKANASIFKKYPQLKPLSAEKYQRFVAIMSEKYQQLEEMIEKYLQEESEIITLEEESNTMQEWKQHYLALSWKENNKQLFSAIARAIKNGIIEYTNGIFNFKCAKGCVGLFFAEAGYTEYKVINPYIKINGKTPAKTTLENCKKNTPPKEWEKIKEIIFPPPKYTQNKLC